MKQFNLFHNLSDGARRGSTLGLLLTLSGRNFSSFLVAFVLLFTIGSGNVWGVDFSHTYTYAEKGTAWTLTDCSDQSSYWLCPTGSDPSIAVIAGIFTGKTITSNVVITINCATYGSGSNPSSTTFKIYNSSACSSQVTAAQSGTLPSSSTYTNVVYTVTKANALAGFTNDLAIKITKPGKQIRLKSITVEFSYTAPAYTVTFNTGTGNPSVSSRTEASAGAGITLPSTSDLTPNCSGDGWVLYGWTTSAYGSSSTTTAPTSTLAGLAGAAYHPGSNITLYAVYRKAEGLAGTTMWSEDFSGYAANGVPSGSITNSHTGTTVYSGTLTYSVENGGGTTKVYTQNNAGGTSPELLVGKSNGTFSSSNIPSGGETSFTLTYKTNQNLSVTSGTSGVTVGSKSGTNPYTRTITLSSSSITNFALTFKMTSSDNARLDDISLVVNGTSYYWSAPTCAACEANPTVGAASLSGSMTSSSIPVSVTGCTPNTNCSWTDYGFVWGTSANPTVSNNKVEVGNSGNATSWEGSLTGSFSTESTYYVRAYGKNGKAGAAFVYGTQLTITPRKIEFEENGGSEVADIYVNSGTAATAPTAPTKDCNTFGGWYQEEGLSTPVDWSATISANKTYYAKWSTIVYTFTFNAGTTPSYGGTITGSHDDISKNCGSSKTLPGETFHSTGYTQIGWAQSDLGSHSNNLGGSTSINRDQAFYPEWAAISYTITYNLNGGTNPGSEPTSYTVATGATLPTPTKTGYTFLGWYANSDLSTGGVQTSIAQGTTGNKEYWAKWEYKVTAITLDKGTGGTANGSASVTYNNSAVTSISHATKTGFHLTGYYTNSSSGTKVLNADGTFAAANVSGYITSSKWTLDNTATTLYAQWEVDTYTITWDANGTNWSGSGHGSPSTSVQYNGKIATFPTSPTSAACDGSKEFVGWSMVEIGDETDTKPTFVSPQTTITATSNFTLYAVFAKRTANSYSLGDVNDLISGKNVIIYNSTRARAMDKTGDGEGRLTGTAVTFSGAVITSPASSVVWTVQLNGAKYQFKNGSDYLYAASTVKTNLFCGSTVDSWTISNGSVSGTYELKSDASGTCELEAYYSDKNGFFFTTYTAGSGNDYNQKFYVPTYTKYQTACSKCATPTFSPEGGIYDAAQNVSISSTAGASIYYTMTTDGSTPADPTSGSTAYSSPISVTVSGTKIKAIAIKDGLDNSSIGSATYTFQVLAPTFSVPAGEYEDVQSIYLECTTPDATIYYTTNGTTPTTGSTRYTGSPIVLSTSGATTTIKAIAVKDGLPNSEVASATYTITKPVGSYTMSFSTGTGNPTVPDKWTFEEDSKQYIELPNGPNPTCSVDGWEFAGWAASTQSETTVAPRMYMPGDTKKLTSNETLYAVYRKETSGTSTSTYNAASMGSGYTEIQEDYWWLQTATGVEFYINSYQLDGNLFQIYYYDGWSTPYQGWALIDAHRRIKDISFVNTSGYPIYSIGTDDGSATLTTTDDTHQTVTCSDNVTQVYLYPQDKKNSSYKIKLSSFTVTYYNSKFNSNPVCNPIQAEAPEKLTSTTGERVYSDNYTITCRDLKASGTLSADITGTDKAMFGCEIANTSIAADGSLTTTYRVYYQPTAAGATHTATLVFKDNSGTPITSDELSLSGRSLPAKFAIVAYNSSTSKYYALDGSMSGEATTPKGLEVTISAGAVASCPSRAVYSLTDRDPQSQYVHLVSGSRKLYGSGVNGITTSTVASDNTGWLLSSDNLTDYHITNEAVNNRGLMLYNGEFGNYAVSQYGVSGYYGDLKIYPITAECTCLEVEDVTVVAKQTTATLTWPAVEGAASYTVTCSGGSVGAVTGTETMTCAITGLTKNTAYTFTVKPNAASSDCSLTTNGGFTTTECDDVPSLGATQCKTDNATISWTCEAATATVRVYSDEACSSQVGDDYTSKTSPFKISSLVPNTTYYYKVWAGGTCPSSVGSFTTEEVHLDVTEWSNNSVTIIYNGDASATLTTFSETAHGDASSNIADSLFFSKYFEAEGNNKMVAIFNGTKDTINLSNYRLVRTHKGSTDRVMELTNFGRKKKGYIAPNEEIIIMRYGSEASMDTCSRKEDNYDDWYIIESGTKDGSGNNIHDWLTFSGPQSIGLYSKTAKKYIDVIGATKKNDGTGDLIQIDANATSFCSYAYKSSYNDGSGFYAEDGDNWTTEEVEDDYFLSTNRYLLVRKNSVKSGMNAIANNTFSGTNPICEDGIGTAFSTLSSEWMGFRIGSGGDAKQKTCEGLAMCGGYDYNDYYVSMDTIKQEKTFEDMKSDPFDGTYVIPVEGLDTMACTNIRIELKDGSDNVIVTKDFQVPIMVSGTKTTTNAIFSSYGKTPATCKTCDVVIMNTATLTREVNGTPSADISQVGNVEVYRGGKLVIPTGTSFTVNSLSLRRDEDTVSSVSLQGTGSLTIGSTKGVSLELRIDPSNWHYVSLPYDCDIDDITFGDGGPAIYGTDYYIREYDGEYRAANKKSRWNHLPAHGTLKKGKGYIIGIAGDGIVKKELRFPMANAVITEEKSNKTIDKLYAWGGNDDDLTPNHKGWNMVGAPFLAGYGYWADGSGNEAEFLPTGKLVADGSGNYEYDGTSVKYIVYPIGNGWGGYGQKAIGECAMDPFTAYFIQIGGDPSEERSITFQTGKRASIVQRRAADYDLEDKHPIWVGVELQNAKGESDATTLLISDQFTDGYDMTNDLVKVRGTYYNYPSVTTKPVLASRNNEGEMAFNALPDETAAVEGVPLNYYAAQAGMYTFALNERYSLEEVESVLLYDATTAKYYDLMSKDYSFSTDRGDNKTRFTLFVRVERKQPEITTDNNDDNILTDGELSLVAVERTLVLSGLSSDAYIYVYDMSGKLLTGERAKGDHGVWRTTVPTAGVYFVRVNSTAGQQTLRTIVK